MLLRLFDNFVMRRGLVLVIVRLHVVFAHGIIEEALPHEQAAQIGMSIEEIFEPDATPLP